MIWSVFGQGRGVSLLIHSEHSLPTVLFTNAVSLEVNALAHSWPKAHKNAFPTVKLLPCMLFKIRKKRESVLLVAPKWPNLPWFPELVEMLGAPP